MAKTYSFDDGSVIEWVDRETLRYSEGNFSSLIWVDFEPGIFNSGRIINSSSIVRWERSPPGSPEDIDMDKRKEILSKIQLYYQSQHKKCRIA